MYFESANDYLPFVKEQCTAVLCTIVFYVLPNSYYTTYALTMNMLIKKYL